MSTVPIPGPKGGIFGLKNVFDFQKDPLHFLTQAAHDYDDIIHFSFGPQYQIYLLTHPDYIREVLVKQWSKTSKWEHQSRVSRKVAPSMITIIEGEQWKQHRRLMAPAFHTQRIKEYMELMVRHTQQLVDQWQDGAVYDMHTEMTKVTMGIIGEILFDIKDIERDAAELSEALKVLLDMFMYESTSVMPVPDWVPTPRNLRENKAIEIATSYLMNIIKARRAEGVDHGDVTSALLHAVDEDDGSTLSDEQVRDELYGLFVAGHETTAILMTWALYMVAQHEDIQQQLHHEISEIMQQGAPSLDDLEAMTLTDRVLQETLRLYPPAWSMFLRTVDEPIELGEQTIPAGGVIYISPYVVHHDARWWDNPQQFDPARFEGDWKARVPGYAFMPFGGGPRVCIGSHMAEMEAELILATIVKNFQMELTTPEHEVQPNPRFTLQPQGGMPLRVRKR